MSEDGLNSDGLKYDRMVEQALLGVVGKSLSYAAKHGLPDDHHFFITFRTDDPGTQIPQRLRERFPSEMTIILQYQFWDLEVCEEKFSVTLSFGEVPEKLTVPFSALVAFADPSVQFGLQFNITNGEQTMQSDNDMKEAEPSPDEAANGTGEEEQKEEANKVVSFDTFRRKQT